MTDITDAECRKRLGWLGPPPPGHHWYVLQLRWWLFEATLLNASDEYIRRRLPRSAGAPEWRALAGGMISDFDRYKQANITAEEFVRSLKLAEAAAAAPMSPEGMLR